MPNLEKKLQKYGEPNSDALVESAINHVNILKNITLKILAIPRLLIFL